MIRASTIPTPATACLQRSCVFRHPNHLTPQDRKGKRRADPQDELSLDGLSIRDNEGEAAEHGVFFDDSAYDYMQRAHAHVLPS